MEIKKKSKKSSFVVGPSSTPAEGIATIDFGIAAETPAKAKSSKYPQIEGSEAAKLADRIIDLQAKYDAVADPFKAAKLELIDLGFPQFFAKNEGRVDAPSSMVAHGTKGGVRVTFKDKFTAGDKDRLTDLLKGKLDKAGAAAINWFRQAWVIKIDGDNIPPAIAVSFLSELKALMAKHGVSHALEVKAAILPNNDFAAKRHFVFDPKMNLAINTVVPQQAAVTTKGVK
jgi:hypothetical protein